MTTYFPLIIEEEDNGAFSAYVAGLPVYAAADTRARAQRAITGLLAAYLEEHPDTTTSVDVCVAKVLPGSRVKLVGPGALIGTQTSRAKARSSALNGRLGGRPRKQPQAAKAR